MTDRQHLFYCEQPDRDGVMVNVEVWVDLEDAMRIAFNATRNKTQTACQGPVHAKVLKDD